LALETGDQSFRRHLRPVMLLAATVSIPGDFQ
jgi:hypothetical protein